MPEMPWRDAIIKVLRDADEPMHYADISEAISSDGLRTELGATPSSTVVSIISTSLNGERANSPFVRVARGQYALKETTVPVREARVDSRDSATEQGAEEETGLINAFGMYWSRGKVLWRQQQTRLLGQQQVNSSPADFAGQRGVYLLFDGREVIYVGRVAEGSMGQRLFQHTVDRLNTRWDRFSWFGVYPVKTDGTLNTAVNGNSDLSTLVVTMEALLIEALEPRQNRQRGEGFKAREFIQVEDQELRQERLKQDIGHLVNQLGTEGSR